MKPSERKSVDEMIEEELTDLRESKKCKHIWHLKTMTKVHRANGSVYTVKSYGCVKCQMSKVKRIED